MKTKTYEEHIESFCNNKGYLIKYCADYKKEYVEFLDGQCPRTCYYSKKMNKLEEKTNE